MNPIPSAPTPTPFTLPRNYRGGLARRAMEPLVAMAERALGLDELQSIYLAARSLRVLNRSRPFSEKALEVIGVTVSVSAEQLARVPSKGPLVVVANHPFGAVEGLVLDALLRRVRPDVRIVANHLLERIPELRDNFLFVDPFDTREAARRNIAPLREAVAWLEGGGALGVFPAGEVAHLRLGRGVVEPPWNDAFARIARRVRASLIPVHFAGRNSAWFQAAGLLHPRLRTVLLPREFLGRRRSTVSVRIGAAMPAARAERFANPLRLADYMRVRTLMLRSAVAPGSSEVASRVKAMARNDTKTSQARIADAGPKKVLTAEVAALPRSRLLVASGDFEVFAAGASEIPATLREIGRLREVTFREVGEGTGRDIDLDRFDADYLHLFLWDRSQERVAGAYRLGLTGDIVPRRGVEGLYTHTLFRFDARLLSRMGPAIELGRSFVTRDYQRGYAGLMLLWKGIGRYVATFPKYRVLFGAVSISADYDSTTKRMMMTFLRANRRRSPLSTLITPRNPPRWGRLRRDDEELLATVVPDIDDVDEMVRDLESDGRGVPVLLRQYLRLNAKLLGFNIDPDFGDALDGLMIVDLADVDRSILGRYLGPETVESFLTRHRAGAPDRARGES